ncbi:hypothetical protein PXH59_10040 [Xenorhabdus sp. SF857]|uniref:hypothetical protein n=1 Tax=Xenorhabdus bakwenae TaxID=3026967 RepID=UPI002557D959|nr:hypothetical protein [Xenorhabdus sp. SF857]WFQ80953.1 hypothetical protein PXH59_07640 [Xenorhabdus sp. SF857]WFQ81342.1 hypothetical protein PXH59_10040 [Xenorhabdus sp. SF857]
MEKRIEELEKKVEGLEKQLAINESSASCSLTSALVKIEALENYLYNVNEDFKIAIENIHAQLNG